MMFTCKSTESEVLLKEYYYKVKMRRSQIFAWVGVALSLGCLGFYFMSWQLWDLIVPVLGGYYVITQFLNPAQTAKKDMKQLSYRFDGQIPAQVCIVDDKGAVSTFDGEETVLRFDDVLAVYELKNTIVMEGMDITIRMAKEGFADGQMEQCLAHIKKSCPNAPHYKR